MPRLRIALAAVVLLVSLPTWAGDPNPGIVVSVLDADGRAVPDVKIYAAYLSAGGETVEYPQQEGRPAKLDFESGFGTSVGLKVTVPFSF